MEHELGKILEEIRNIQANNNYLLRQILIELQKTNEDLIEEPEESQEETEEEYKDNIKSQARNKGEITLKR